MVEWIKYTPCGKPIAIPVGDTKRGGGDFAFDETDKNNITGGGAYSVRRDTNLDGVVDSSDVTHASSITGGYQTLGRGILSSPAIDNRIGYAGYRYDPSLAGADRHLYHVRFRVYFAHIGRWATRDPLGYVDGMSFYEYVASAPLSFLDPWGLAFECPSIPSICHDGDCGGSNKLPFVELTIDTPEEESEAEDLRSRCQELANEIRNLRRLASFHAHQATDFANVETVYAADSWRAAGGAFTEFGELVTRIAELQMALKKAQQLVSRARGSDAGPRFGDDIFKYRDGPALSPNPDGMLDPIGRLDAAQGVVDFAFNVSVLELLRVVAGVIRDNRDRVDNQLRSEARQQAVIHRQQMVLYSSLQSALTELWNESPCAQFGPPHRMWGR